MRQDTNRSLQFLKGILFLILAWTVEECSGQTSSPVAWQPKSDVIFVLDSTDTVGSANFDTMKQFMKEMVQQLDIGPTGIQVGTITYGNGIHNEFNLKDVSGLQDALNSIDAIPFRGGKSDASDAFKYAHEIGFTGVNGARPGVPHIIIHVTDEPTNDLAATIQETNRALDKGTVIYSVGVGEGTGKDKLSQVTSDPLSRYLVHADTFSSLKSLVPTLSSRIKNGVPVSSQQLPSPTSCLQKADLVFLVDSSDSVGQNDFQHLEDFLKDAIIQLPIDPNGVRVGLLQFANYPSLEFGLDTYTDKMSLLRATDSVNFMGGSSNTADAINYATDEVFSSKVGARYGVPHIAVVITDGQSTDDISTAIAADRARARGISLLSVGVGPNIDLADLKDIANDPDPGHVFQSATFKGLKGLSKQILDAACNFTAVATAPPTLPPGVTTADPCYDAKDNCAYYTKDTCTSYGTWARTNCNKYCGFCQVQAPTLECKDDVKCSDYGSYVCTDASYAGWARQHCRQYCGFCDKDAKSSGFYGKCYYKGREYSHSEKWQDGCDYECVCEDGETGTYRCYNKCPVYKNLPQECTLVPVPNECCLKPVCDFKPEITSTQGSGKGYNPQGVEMCEYGGMQYYDGQTWEVGCDLRCTCTDAKLGSHVCQSYCPSYKSVPGNCRLTKKPGDCCAAPVCEFETVTGIVKGDGSISGNGVGAPTPDRTCVDKLSDCRAYGKAACGEYPEWARDKCALFCNVCVVKSPAPTPDDYCWYDGKQHAQNDTWSDGCDTDCTCEIAAYGYYRCINKCPDYSDVPKGCTRQKKVGECCPVIECTNSKFFPSATNVNSLGNGGGLTMVDPNTGNPVDVLPTIPTNSSAVPNRGPQLNGCLFLGSVYIQGQQWEVGCNLTCLCVNGSTGVYECRERCPKYNNVPPTCSYEPDPSDPCCTFPNNCGVPYIPMPVYAKGVTNVGAVVSPNIKDLVYGHYTTQFAVTFAKLTVPTLTTPAQAVVGYCQYKGGRYLQGQIWKDGCDFNCVCEDGITGQYRCVEQCQHYVDLPPQYCHLATDPINPCCQIPVCNFTAGYDVLEGQRNETLPPTTSTTTPPTTTVAPPKQKTSTQVPVRRPMCEYKGMFYPEGQTWYDGCDYKCTCDNAVENLHTCSDRCPSYVGDIVNCTLEVDPNDPQCCTTPVCQGRGLPPKQITGRNPSMNSDKCVYKGAEYNAGDVWDDGCQYQCECTDATIGLYRCLDKCPSFPNLPSNCKLVQDFASPCCKVPQCTPTPAPVPGVNASFCDYFGAKYYDGQTWSDGCDFNCRCENAAESLYICNERCPSYDNLPLNCHLVTDNKDPCCEIPECTETPANPNQVPTLPPGTIQGNALVPNPGQIPVPGQKPSPGLIPIRNTCVYNGQTYNQDDQWYDGCDYWCTCTNATIGAYSCVERCTRYPELPKQCQMVKDASNPCCEIAVCDPNYSTPTPNTLVPIKHTTLVPRKGDFCTFNGQFYAEGQAWYDGCDFKCVCEDGQSGAYRCTDRCGVQPPLPAGCTLVSDPKDPVCCQVPSCSYTTLVPGQKGTLVPSLAPAVVTGRQVTPSPLPANSPRKDACVYNGAIYREGQKWADGCDYNCECVDGPTGQYSCTEICPQYASLPPQCVYVQDPNNPCCQVPFCDPAFPTPSTLAPQNTLVPGINVEACVYNGVPYKQGDRWEDGCDLACVCEDAKMGNYRCDKRCPSYDQVPSGCVLNASPNDACCQELTCQPGAIPTTSPLPYPLPYPIPAKIPGVKTGQTVNTNGNDPKGCLYNGQIYKQGETWNDRCDLKCTCLDEDAAVYQCTERCVVFKSLPPACQLVPNPTDTCCEVPRCSNGTDPAVSTLVPPQPGVPTLVPGTKDMCVYNGAYYNEGQQWYDGCDKVCVCLNATTNQKSCSSRCVDYSQVTIPPQCQMVADPSDPACCEVPQCIPTPGPNGYPSPTPTSPGDPKPTPTVFVNVPGIVTGMAPIATPTPDPNGGPTPSPRFACVYKGQEYRQGIKWQDGCDYICVCVNETTGYYKCDQRCPSYPLVPAQCQLTQDPADFCCKVVSCDFSQPTPNPFVAPPTATRDPNAPTPPTRDPNAPTLTPTPNGIPLATPPTLRPDLAFCVYNGAPYSQGSTWTIGCETKCRCEDATTNFYTCADRCPTYMSVPAGCSKSVDPSDACCSIVECVPDPNSTPIPNANTAVPKPVPTLAPGVITGKPGPGITGRRVGCTHNGMAYRQGDTWSDGCAYNCECLDDQTGLYKCVERCPKFTNIPTSCSLVPDQNDLCCQVPSCPTPTPSPLFPNMSTTPTAVPQKTDFCVYNGKMYTQGQVWYDGCEQTCVCEDAKIQYYRCTERCPVYSNIPPTCVLVADPDDPTCCQQPQCDPGTGVTATGFTGMVSGSGAPTPNPRSTLSPAMNNSCYYKGVYYSQGQKWRDACDFNCECVDGTSGVYTCTEICPQYPSPLGCPMVRDPANPCCTKPDCSSLLTPTPGNTPSPVATPYPVAGTTLSPQKAFCVYDGLPYNQFDSWNVACDLKCRCEDAVQGRVNCDQRCPAYTNVPSGCVMVTDPFDSCCQIPNCVPQPGQPLDPKITGVVGTITGNRLPSTNPRGPVPDTCIYHGVSYKEGEAWDDGCQYRCECIDGVQGKYVCFERCQRYPQVPSECALLQDPSDACCQKLYCGIPTKPSTPPTTPGTPSPPPTFTPTPASPPSPGTGLTPPTPPVVTRTTLRPPTVDACVYNGQRYTQDQTWYDGCNTLCSCDNATANFYSCQERCTRYTGVPTSCTNVPDPDDPACCSVPDCPVPYPSGPSPTPIPSIVPLGEVTGVGKVPQPTAAPTPASFTGTTSSPPTAQPGCVYNGTIYSQGYRWSSGCEWNCVCDDGQTGKYTCTERCPRQPLSSPPQGIGCSVAADPKDACCQVTVCAQASPTPAPPSLSTTSNTTVTPTPQGDFCVYNGAFYAEKEVWYDGCQSKCTCDDGKNGYYTCNDRCAQYPNLQPSCTLVTDPTDTCCTIPECQPAASTLTPPTGTTYVLNPNPKASFFGQGGTPSGQPGSSDPKTGYTNACLYKGNFYAQDQKFADGCQYQCTCTDALRGRYQCTERCTSYPMIPPECTMETDPHDSCCMIPICTPVSPATTTPMPTPPTGPVRTTYAPPTKMTKPPNMCLYGNNVYNRGDFWEVPGKCQFACICDDPVNNIYTCHNACPMYTELPTYCSLVDDPSSNCCKKPYCQVNGKDVTNLIPFGTTDVFGSSSPPTNKPGPDDKRDCIYKGVTKTPGETWVEGCDFACECLGEDGMYSCASRCPSYSKTAAASNCSSVSAPGQCCSSLQCSIPGVGEYTPTPQVPALPAIVPGPVAIRPTPKPTGPTRSPQILIVPPTGSTPLPGGGSPLPAGTPLSGIRDRCVYDNRLYAEGESWDPDCTLHCTCVDQKTGFYQCDPQCEDFSNVQLPAGCFLAPDVNNCCAKPMCRTDNGTLVDPIKTPQPQFPVVGTPGKTVTGSRPVYTVGSNSGQRTGCFYKSVQHNEGDTWKDGCDFSCTCENGALGLYKCVDICPKLPALPAGCETRPTADGCCQNIVCFSTLPSQTPPVTSKTPTTPTPTQPSTTPTTTPTTTPSTTTSTPTTTSSTTTTTTPTTTAAPTTTPDGMYDPNCHDNLDNCKSYGQASCQDPYVGWARKNCNMTCGFCTPSYTTTPAPCVDELQCEPYGKSVCTTYVQWAKKNCRNYCGLCGSSPTPPPTPTTPPGSQCMDKLNCGAYGDYICISDQYKSWVNDNCAAYCGLCSDPGPTSSATTPPTAPAGWSLLLKGAAGVPGDLASLWKSGSTLNENTPNATILTPEFKGHYKSGRVNQWDQCKFTEVMVSVFKNGIEEGNIIFDVKGLDRNSWFKPDRIISSTWNDIRTNSATFSLDKAPPTSREFMATDSSSCTGNAWLFVSMSDVCPYEQTGTAPRFLYSTTSSAAQLGKDQLGEGDVLAVFGRGGNCNGNTGAASTAQTRTSPAAVCAYKGTNYQQGDTWADGCALNCTCVDASKGRYLCNDKCPTYPNLQSTCRLITKPGECCQEPICNGFEPVKGCYYKGASYSEGAQWTDGCDFDCLCANATTGDFKCKSICPRWNLPSQCTLGDPAPGLCCSTPKCPFTWTPPAGYVPR